MVCISRASGWTSRSRARRSRRGASPTGCASSLERDSAERGLVVPSLLDRALVHLQVAVPHPGEPEAPRRDLGAPGEVDLVEVAEGGHHAVHVLDEKAGDTRLDQLRG